MIFQHSTGDRVLRIPFNDRHHDTRLESRKTLITPERIVISDAETNFSARLQQSNSLGANLTSEFASAIIEQGQNRAAAQFYFSSGIDRAGPNKLYACGLLLMPPPDEDLKYIYRVAGQIYMRHVDPHLDLRPRMGVRFEEPGNPDANIKRAERIITSGDIPHRRDFFGQSRGATVTGSPYCTNIAWDVNILDDSDTYLAPAQSGIGRTAQTQFSALWIGWTLNANHSLYTGLTSVTGSGQALVQGHLYFERIFDPEPKLNIPRG